jgi:hypothetical protein
VGLIPPLALPPPPAELRSSVDRFLANVAA